jgi:hypothetical protein
MTPKFGCKKNRYGKDNDNKNRAEILRLGLIFRKELVPKRDVAGSCKGSVTSHWTMQCHFQLAIYMSSLIQYCIRPGFGLCKRSPK